MKQILILILVFITFSEGIFANNINIDPEIIFKLEIISDPIEEEQLCERTSFQEYYNNYTCNGLPLQSYGSATCVARHANCDIAAFYAFQCAYTGAVANAIANEQLCPPPI